MTERRKKSSDPNRFKAPRRLRNKKRRPKRVAARCRGDRGKNEITSSVHVLAGIRTKAKKVLFSLSTHQVLPLSFVLPFHQSQLRPSGSCTFVYCPFYTPPHTRKDIPSILRSLSTARAINEDAFTVTLSLSRNIAWRIVTSRRLGK